MMKINEIFYSLQGEGRFAGVPAVFIRFSGCNLKCPFCDTKHQNHIVMSEEEIISQLGTYPAHHVVLTGGEPTLQVTSSLVRRLKHAGYFVQMETNGTGMIPCGCDIDWITCSPKNDGELLIQHIDEMKLLFMDDKNQDIERYARINAREYRLQPLDTQDEQRNIQIQQNCIRYILDHPQWSLSLQTHKILNIS